MTEDFEFELSNNAKATEATQGLTLVIGGVDYFLREAVGDLKISTATEEYLDVE